MKKYNSTDWSLLLSNNAISGDLKIECIKKYLSLDWGARERIVILNDIKKKLEYHTIDYAMDHSAYRSLENHVPFFETDPSTLSIKTSWEDDIERPQINLFEYLGIKYCFENSLEHKIAVIKNYKNWDVLFHDDCFIKVLDFVIEEIKIFERNILSVSKEKKYSNNKLTFKFVGNVEKLTKIVNRLCQEIELLNQEETKPDQLIKVLTAKNILR